MYTIFFLPSVKNELSQLPKKLQKLIDKRVVALSDQPFPPGYRKLKDRPGQYRIRQGDYRIIYTVEHQKVTVIVIKIGHRGDVYK